MSKSRRPHSSIPSPSSPPSLPGWPGYRTRPGRSGNDPFDTNREAAFMQGSFARRLLTGQLRTNNPAYIAALGLVGLGLLLPFFCSFAESLDQRAVSGTWVCSTPITLMAGFFLFNAFVNGIAYARKHRPSQKTRE